MKVWRIWAKALGEKASADASEADRVALIRTMIVGVNFVTCFFHYGEYDSPLVMVRAGLRKARSFAGLRHSRRRCSPMISLD